MDCIIGDSQTHTHAYTDTHIHTHRSAHTHTRIDSHASILITVYNIQFRKERKERKQRAVHTHIEGPRDALRPIREELTFGEFL